MKRLHVSMMFFLAVFAGAQESAQYRITYDCDAQFGPVRKVYRWNLDIASAGAVFFNHSSREMAKAMEAIVSENDVTAVMAGLNAMKGKYPNPNSLEVQVNAPSKGKYIYRNEIISDKLWYEESLPETDWEMTGRESTVCGYACLQATGSVYGRAWTVWFAPEIPLPYGPYVLGGLPGLILDAADADGLFHFTAIGLEQHPEGATVAISDLSDAVKCTREKYLKLREKANGQSLNDRLREMGIADGAVVKVVSADGKDIDMDESRPKNNYLDLE